MTLRYQRVGRTTDLVEEAMRAVDTALIEHFHLSNTRWDWRELFVSTVEEFNSEVSNFGASVSFRKHIKVVGWVGGIAEGHKVTAVAYFEGYSISEQHSYDLDYSESDEPLKLETINFEILASAGNKISKTLGVYLEDTYTFFEPLTQKESQPLEEA